MASSSSAALVGQKVLLGVPPRARAARSRRGASVPVRASIAEPEPSQTKPGYFQRKKEQDAKVFTRKKLTNLISPTPSDIAIAQARPRRSAPRRARPFARFHFVLANPKRNGVWMATCTRKTSFGLGALQEYPHTLRGLLDYCTVFTCAHEISLKSRNEDVSILACRRALWRRPPPQTKSSSWPRRAG